MPDKKLEEIINRILQVIIPDKIILFGSRARGESREDSDYDILIIKSGIEDELKTENAIYRSFIGMIANADILVRTPEEVEKSKNKVVSVIKTAIKEGVVVYG